MTTSRRDWQLQKMGITQYQLRRPAVFQGEVALQLPAQVQLIILAQRLPELCAPLMQDILRAMSLSNDNVYCLTMEQAAMLPEDLNCLLWLMGEASLNEPLPELPLSPMTSPDYHQLLNDPLAKRQLWSQICQYEHHFHAEQR